MQIQKSVEYPAVLALSPTLLSADLIAKERITHSTTSTTSSGPIQYQLQAVVLHHGKKATGGHYSTFILENTATANHPTTSSSSTTANTTTGTITSTTTGTTATTTTTNTSTNGMQDRERRSGTSTIWKSVNDAKISTVSQNQVLGAQEQVKPIVYV